MNLSADRRYPPSAPGTPCDPDLLWLDEWRGEIDPRDNARFLRKKGSRMESGKRGEGTRRTTAREFGREEGERCGPADAEEIREA